MKVNYSVSARNDLRNIYEYIALQLLVPDTASALVEKIMAEIRTLESFPERNPLYRDEPWHSLGMRYMPVKNYIVFYTVIKELDTVAITRIIYGGRDINKQLSEDSGM